MCATSAAPPSAALPRWQRDAIESHYLQEIPVATLASPRRQSPSTIYGSLGQARADAFRARYPDGRRIVIIDEAA